MEAYGATVHPSPSDITSAGRAVLAEHPDSTGSLGIAISEAVEVAGRDPAVRYALGSVLNHVLLHQTVIGEEALKQLAKAGDTPDLIVGCTGGGSNFAGLVFPFLREKLAGKMNPVLRAVEPAACPSFTRGVYAYDFGDTAGIDAAVQDAHPRARLRAGPDPRGRAALPRHVAAAVAHLRAWACSRRWPSRSRSASRPGCGSPGPRASCPRPSPPTRSPPRIEEALRCKETGEEKVILTALCGHGLLDLAAYGNYQAGQVTDFDLPAEAVEDALKRLPAGV